MIARPAGLGRIAVPDRAGDRAAGSITMLLMRTNQLGAG
jgi:hypothetical protein